MPLRRTVHDTHDAPTGYAPDDPVTAEVFQEEPVVGPVAVDVVNVVRTDEMPTETIYRNVVILAGTVAEKVLQADPRRKNAVMWCLGLGAGAEGVVLGNSDDEARTFKGVILLNSTVPMRFETADRGEVWARGLLVNETGGIWTSYAAATDDIILCLAIEQWAE